MSKYLKSFIKVSSCPAFIIFFYGTSQFDPEVLNYSYSSYSFTAPIYLGFMNVLATFIGNIFGLSLRERMMVGGLISGLTIMAIIKYFQTVKFEKLDNIWQHYITIFLTHLFVFNFIIYYLELSLQ